MNNQIIVDSFPRNYHGGFVLVKPTKPFYQTGQDYQILSFPNNEILCKARLVMKRTFNINKIPEVVSILYRDIKASDLKRILKEHSTEVDYDVMLFSSNSHYNDWYKDKQPQANEMRQKEQEQVSLF